VNVRLPLTASASSAAQILTVCGICQLAGVMTIVAAEQIVRSGSPPPPVVMVIVTGATGATDRRIVKVLPVVRSAER
jgi:hypothetical protein